MIYYEQSISRDSERKGGCFVNEYIQALPGILFWVVLFVVIKSVRAKRDEESKHPKNAAQRELVDDVIATIERTAPDFDGGGVIPSNDSGGGGVSFCSLRGETFEYGFESHGYIVSEGMALALAAAIAKRFGSEYRPIRDRDHFICGYRIMSPRELAEEQEKQRHKNSLKRL